MKNQSGRNHSNKTLERNNVPVFEKRMHFLFLSFLLILVVLSVLLILFHNILWPEFKLPDPTLHSAIESIGALAAIIIALMPMQVLMGEKRPSFIFLSTAFLVMGVWDMFHSFFPVGDGFVITHNLAIFFGGLLFALILVPWKEKLFNYKNAILLTAAIISLLGVIIISVKPELFPEMVHNGNFTPLAKNLNLIAALLYLAAGVKLMIEYFKLKNIGLLLIVFVAIISVIVGVSFAFSDVWSDSWWLWHFIRLSALLAMMIHILLRIRRTNDERAKAIEELDNQNKRLLESEERYRIVFEGSPLGKSSTGIDGSLHINNKFSEITGYNKEELQKHHWKDITHPDDIRESEEVVKSLLAGKVKSAKFEKRYLHKEGHYVWTEVNTTLHRNADGEPEFFITSISDITQRKKMQEQIELNEHKFRTLFNSVSIPLCYVKEDGRIDSMNNRFIKDLGYTLEDIPTLDEWWVKAYPEKKYRTWVMNNWNKAVEESIKNKTDIKSDIYDVTCKNGEVRKIIIAGITIENDFLATFIDMTEQIKAEEAIELEKNFTDSVINAMPGIFYLFDINGRFIKWNNALAELSGYKYEEIGSKSPIEFITPEDRKKVGEAIQSCFETGEVYVEADFLAKGKDNVPFYFTGIRVIYDDQPLLLGVGIDISRRKVAEQKLKDTLNDLKRSNRELEQFAYVASHDLQEPLRMISSYTQLLERRYKDKLDEKADKYIYYVVDGASRMQNLINDLLDFSRIATRGEEFAPTKTNDVVAKAIQNLESKIKESGAKIDVEDLPVINADSAQVERLFTNLIANAIKFRKPDTKPEIRIFATKENGLWKFSVKDNGIGIKKEFEEKVFTIFQRLHGMQEYPGTGIGLAICRQIVQRHKGEIWFESDGKNGTTFFFTMKVY